jgi:hypothetical protein
MTLHFRCRSRCQSTSTDCSCRAVESLEATAAHEYGRHYVSRRISLAAIHGIGMAKAPKQSMITRFVDLNYQPIR